MSTHQTQIGKLPFHFHLYWDEQGRLTKLDFKSPAESADPGERQPPYAIAALLRELKHYFFRGEPLLPLHWSYLNTDGMSEFARKVYEAAAQIPHGETRSYSWVAGKIGKPLAARAVGQALRRNPFPVLVPCHRVVGDKSLGGFMGSTDPERLELRLKTWLLELEGSYLSPPFAFLSAVPPLRERAS